MMGRLAKLLLRASLVAVPLSGCCAFHDGDGTWHRFAARATYGPMIDACLADETKCNMLCYQVIEDQEEWGWGFKEMDGCVVERIRSDGLELEIGWTEECQPAGRRPRGLVAARDRGGGAGGWLARVATVEAASITAFARLVRSLTRLGAPRPLIASARHAIADEIRHARVVARLARAAGARPAPPVIAPVAEPSVVELALDNAIEGQVVETFGALLATCQARTASDPAVRTAFVSIARDETRHAVLAHELAPWLERQLGAADRALVRDARRHAIARLGTDYGLAAADRARLGIPAPDMLGAAAGHAFAALA